MATTRRSLSTDWMKSASARTTLAHPLTRSVGVSTQFGKPRFRLSCREADWLGANDQKHLESVSPDSKVTVLRLNPLTDSDIADILNTRPDIGDAQEFIALAQEQRVDGLLSEPTDPRICWPMLWPKAAGGPKSRKETFEIACGQMVREHNEEHQAAQESNSPPTTDQLLDAAGRLCAIQLISGAAGYTLRGQVDEDYPAPDQCDYDRTRSAPVCTCHEVVQRSHPITVSSRSIATSPNSSALGTLPKSSKEISQLGA